MRRSWLVKFRDTAVDGETCVVQFASEEGVGSAINQTADEDGEGPAKDGVDRDIGAESNTEFDGTAISEEIREVIGDDGAKSTAE